MTERSQTVGSLSQRFSPRARLLLSLGLVVAAVGVLRSAWSGAESQVRLDPAYRIDAASIRINTPPSWVPEGAIETSFVRAGITDPGGAGRLSMLDEAGTVEVAISEAVAANPFVRSVTAVERLSPRGASVEVVYRQPVVLAITSLGAEPLDVEAVRLPRGKLTTADLAALPRLRLQPLETAGLPAPPLVGAGWGDPRVRGACALVEKLQPLWHELRLEDLTADPAPERAGGLAFPTYTLRTRGDTSIVWGAAPGFGPPSEPTFEAKLNRFRQFVAVNGPLDSVAGTPRRIHVRYTLRIEHRVAAKPEAEPADTAEPIKQAAKPRESR